MSASLTAYNIVVALKNQGVTSPYLGAFEKFCADSVGKKILRKIPPQLFLRLMERLFVPGMCKHFIARKKIIREQAEVAIAEGIKQIVTVGAGFDTLALTIAPLYPDCCFIEMDLPATQQQKTSALKQANILFPNNIFFHPCDLSHTSLTEELQRTGIFSPKAPAFFVFEGVLMYVPEQAVLHTFQQCAALNADNRILFGAMAHPDSDGSFFQRLTSELLGIFGENIRWVCPSEQMPIFLNKSNFIVEKSWKYQEMQENPCKNLPLEDENYYLARIKNV